jgi:rare lipoprotein A
MNRELRRGTPLNHMMAAADGRVTGATQVAAADQDFAPDPGDDQSFAAYPTVETSIASANADYETPDYFVQVGSFADPSNAERAREELAGSGPVRVEELMGSQGPLYRVRIGPMKNEGQAQLALRQAVDLGHPDARLIMANAAL